MRVQRTFTIQYKIERIFLEGISIILLMWNGHRRMIVYLLLLVSCCVAQIVNCIKKYERKSERET